LGSGATSARTTGARARAPPSQVFPAAAAKTTPTEKAEKSETEWRAKLDPQRYAVLREGATERPFSGALYHNHDDGTYACGACGTPLFGSETKFESGSGWPSFFTPLDADNITEIVDRSHGMTRTEVRCAKCGSHLGHLFDDGPAPTGLRYCINSLALDFDKRNG
jgi:peptide-methionine (R)-S-oxide reductase